MILAIFQRWPAKRKGSCEHTHVPSGSLLVDFKLTPDRVHIPRKDPTNAFYRFIFVFSSFKTLPCGAFILDN